MTDDIVVYDSLNLLVVYMFVIKAGNPVPITPEYGPTSEYSSNQFRHFVSCRRKGTKIDQTKGDGAA
jgi:hypothetical protein